MRRLFSAPWNLHTHRNNRTGHDHVCGECACVRRRNIFNSSSCPFLAYVSPHHKYQWIAQNYVISIYEVTHNLEFIL